VPWLLATGHWWIVAVVVLAWLGPGSAADPLGPVGRLGSRASAAPATDRLAVVTCAPGDGDRLLATLEDRGARVAAYLSPERWLVAGGAVPSADAIGAQSVIPWRPEMGVAAELRALPERAPDRHASDVGVVIAIAPGTDLAAVADRLGASGAVVTWSAATASPLPQIGLRVSIAALPRLVEVLDEMPELAWAVPQAPVRLLNDDSVWRCQSGEPDSTPIFERGLAGQGQVIGLMDTGIDIDDCRFDDPVVGLPALNRSDGVDVEPEHRKVLAVDFHWAADWPPGARSWDDRGHGSHVAGSAAGDELGNGVHDGYDGMAPAAKLVIQDGGAAIDDCADLPGLGCPLKPLEPVLAQAYAQGARIHSDSWGDEENILPFGRYTERTADVDRFVWNHRDMLVFFAAGNSGPGSDTVISPAVGKNVVAVGATLHGDFEPTCVVPFSSRGWSRDGRVKPDLVVPGMSVVSVWSNGIVPGRSCNSTQSSGTSMAAPTAAGLAALVRQYFTDGFYPSGRRRAGDTVEPSAALVKAVLIASAVDLSTRGCSDEPVPSRDQGWGLVQLDTALSFAGDDQKLVVDDHRLGFRTSGDDPVTITVTASRPGPLKIVLVWTDAPSSSLADGNLVNDLDLTVIGAGGSYLGNRLLSGVSAPGGEPDRVNNVEVVWLPLAEPGTWTIEVRPHAVVVPPQDFALVVTGRARPDAGPRQSGRRVTP
jgi:subtilisin family serine protease